MLTRKIRTGIILSLVLAVIVMTAIAVYADLPQMLRALVNFCWEFLPLILGLTLFNYFWRFIKWQYYLGRLDIDVHWLQSLLIFLSGLSMAITPGKIGEFLKSYLLKTSTDVPISRSSPIVVAERLTDGIAMIGLAMTGLILYRSGWEVLLTLSILGLGLGVITLVLFRTTQHIDFSTVRGEMSKNQQPGINGALSKDAGQTTFQTASVLTSTGDKFI